MCKINSHLVLLGASSGPQIFMQTFAYVPTSRRLSTHSRNWLKSNTNRDENQIFCCFFRSQNLHSNRWSASFKLYADLCSSKYHERWSDAQWTRVGCWIAYWSSHANCGGARNPSTWFTWYFFLAFFIPNDMVLKIRRFSAMFSNYKKSSADEEKPLPLWENGRGQPEAFEKNSYYFLHKWSSFLVQSTEFLGYFRHWSIKQGILMKVGWMKVGWIADKIMNFTRNFTHSIVWWCRWIFS